MNTEQMEVMLKLQDKMNSTIHPKWREQNFPWYRAIWLECGELVEHHGYKWWKKQEPDMPQVKLEIVDIWHFGLSIWLSSGDSYESVAVSKVKSGDVKIKPKSIVESAEELAENTLRNKGLNIVLFLHLLAAAGMTFDELFHMYVGKNVLNMFRQANGYKEGTYVKIWDGREDNEVLHDILINTEVNDNFANIVYAKLEYEYSGVEK